jgi:hypothetical protein
MWFVYNDEMRGCEMCTYKYEVFKRGEMSM